MFVSQIPICSSGVRSLGFIVAHSVIQCDSPPAQVLQTLLKVSTLVDFSNNSSLKMLANSNTAHASLSRGLLSFREQCHETHLKNLLSVFAASFPGVARRFKRRKNDRGSLSSTRCTRKPSAFGRHAAQSHSPCPARDFQGKEHYSEIRR